MQWQWIKLIQVTGNATISGCISADLYSHTDKGLVKIYVEAYIVKGMSTLFILGNDFAHQYSISVVQREDRSWLEFGDCRRGIQVKGSTSSSFIEEYGHTFQIKYLQTSLGIASKKSTYQRNQQFKQRRRSKSMDNNVRSTAKSLIPSHASATVPVALKFVSGLNYTYVRKVFSSNRNPDDRYMPPWLANKILSFVLLISPLLLLLFRSDKY